MNVEPFGKDVQLVEHDSKACTVTYWLRFGPASVASQIDTDGLMVLLDRQRDVMGVRYQYATQVEMEAERETPNFAGLQQRFGGFPKRTL